MILVFLVYLLYNCDDQFYVSILFSLFWAKRCSADKTLFLGVAMRMSLEEISV